MYMTDEQKYSELLKELGALLADKNSTISCQKWHIDDLKKKLEKAEAERDCAQTELEIMAGRVQSARDEIDLLKGGAA